MTPVGSETHDRILESAYGLFYREGFQRAGMEAIAAEAGVTKRTLYRHFSSKDDLIAEVLAAQGRFAVEVIDGWANVAMESPQCCIREIFAKLRTWSRAPGWQGSGFTRAVMELAWAPGHPARRAAAVQKEAVEAAIGRILEQAGADESMYLASKVMLLIEGAMVLCLIHRHEKWFDIAEQAAMTLQTNPGADADNFGPTGTPDPRPGRSAP